MKRVHDALLVIMAKNPVPGRVKTRLSPPLTETEAAEVYRCFLADSSGMKRTASETTPAIAPDVRGVVLDVHDLAQVLHKSPATIKRDIHRKPQSLPPRLKIPGSSV